jgi:hypothetical protein
MFCNSPSQIIHDSICKYKSANIEVYLDMLGKIKEIFNLEMSPYLYRKGKLMEKPVRELGLCALQLAIVVPLL